MCRKRDEKGGRGGVAMAYQGDIWPLVAVVVGWEWKYIVLTPVYRENLTPRPRKSTERNCPSSPIPQTHPSFCPSYTYTPLASRWSWGGKSYRRQGTGRQRLAESRRHVGTRAPDHKRRHQTPATGRQHRSPLPRALPYPPPTATLPRDWNARSCGVKVG